MTCIVWPLGLAVVNALALVAWTLIQVRTLTLQRASDCATIDERVGWRRSLSPSSDRQDEVFVSVHLPIHDEPPAVVVATLEALARLECAAFEVIVIDNNTVDENIWRPIDRHCLTLGSRFRFYHRMNVGGAKAGALEIARSLMDERTTHVAVVDADYQVAPDFLSLTLDALRGTGANYAQCPQAYRDVTDDQEALRNELDDYFDRHADAAQRDGRVLLTGTLSVIEAAALRTVGGWPTETVTEDAELAMALQRHSFRGTYVPRCAGAGLLPPSVRELQGQRHRWIVGNLHTLIRSLARSARMGRMDVALAHWAQLSAWCSFTAVPILLMSSGVCLTLLGLADTELWHRVSLVAAATIAGQLLVTACLSRVTPGFFAVRWLLAISSGWATLFALSMQRTSFRCTKRQVDCSARPSMLSDLDGVLLAAAGVGAIALSWTAASAVLLLCASSGFALRRLDRILATSTPLRAAEPSLSTKPNREITDVQGQ